MVFNSHNLAQPANQAGRNNTLFFFWTIGKKHNGRVDQIYIYVSLRLRVQNAVPAQPCVGKIQISLVLLNFLHCNFRLWFETP